MINRGGGSYPSADMQSVYFIAPADWVEANGDPKVFYKHWNWKFQILKYQYFFGIFHPSQET